ncbi:MAG: RHS repeat-associated core domain-containing protein, partial [Polyangiaceae bacterium]|nr:RHS repeat-associated core domain-containing protein [Polyangiaceae bacterium]
AYGEVGVDEAITDYEQSDFIPTPNHVLGEGNWAYATVEGWVEGSVDLTRRNWSRLTFDGHGNPIRNEVYLAGSVPLIWTDPSAPADSPLADGWYVTGETVFDSVGNSVFTWAAGDRCSSVEFDPDYKQLPIIERVHTGASTSLMIEGQTFSCGDHALEAIATHDRGLQSLQTTTDINGGASKVVYDSLGRMKELYIPNPHTTGISELPTIMVEYRLPDTTMRPVSLLIQRTQDGVDHDDPEYHETYAYVDGFGRTIVTLSEADPVDDGFAWVVEGLTDYDAKGAERRKYLAWSYDDAPGFYDLSVAPTTQYGSQRYDAFGRSIQTMGLDGHVNIRKVYHALSVDIWDAEDIGPGVHQGTYASERKDGHGRVVETTERVKEAGTIQARHVRTQYLPTGEPIAIMRHSGANTVGRTMEYDTLGRMVLNLEPNLGPNGWRYLFDSSGDLVATSDPRGCGSRFAYDSSGRLVSEDYVPCESHHAPYSPNPEVVYEYDDPPVDSTSAFTYASSGQDCRTANFARGRPVAITDRAQRMLNCYDGRGRVVEVARQVADPNGVLGGRWYNRRVAYDGADRPVVESTGAMLLDPGQSSEVRTSYTRRGKVWQVDSSYGLLVEHVKRDADGLVKEIKYGDAASTTTAMTYDNLRRIRNVTTYRAKMPTWVYGSSARQVLLQDEQFSYDRVGNPTEIRDWRDPNEWPVGAKPVTRKMQYDSLYRLSRIDYQYSTGDDDWVDPYAAEAADSGRIQPSPRADFSGEKRVRWQSFAYDWVGNSIETHDDAKAFYDRSLGSIGNDGYKLVAASNDGTSARHGSLGAVYDLGGNLIELNVGRNGPCVPAYSCSSQHFEYQWDEVGRLIRARRWDTQNPAAVPPDADLSFAYDSSNQRVRKSSGNLHTLYVFVSLEVRRAGFDGVDYELIDSTQVPYLFVDGVRLARVVHGSPTHVFLELGDHLGSTNVVLDRATGQLVQRDTAYAYGGVESSYRTGEFDEFREDYRFTGKEDDVEVGLIYFGARYYAPLLGRWISADPLAVHSPGEADLNLYAYVHGRALIAVDPVGLDDDQNSEQKSGGGAAQAGQPSFANAPFWVQVGGEALPRSWHSNYYGAIQAAAAIPRALVIPNPSSMNAEQRAWYDSWRSTQQPDHGRPAERTAEIRPPDWCEHNDCSDIRQKSRRTDICNTVSDCLDDFMEHPAAEVIMMVAPVGGVAKGVHRVAKLARAANGTAKSVQRAAPVAQVGTRGTILDTARFAQRDYSPTFGRFGPLRGRTVEEVAEALRTGAMKPSELPINYVVRGGNQLILNTRSAHALQRAGIPRSKWTAYNRTGDQLYEGLLTGQLRRNRLTDSGIETAVEQVR